MDVSPYASSFFLALPDFRTARHSLDRTRGYIKELGAIICRYGLQGHIGVSLLHKHFSISPDEQLIKHFIGNSAYIRPYPQPVNENVVPYLWKFEHNQAAGVQSFYPLEFVDTTQRASKGRIDAQRFVSSEAFLAEISAKLRALNLENVFGLCTLHGDGEIILGNEELLLETTDHTNRILILAPATKTSAEAIETSWQFKFSKNGDDDDDDDDDDGGKAKCDPKLHCTSNTHCLNTHR